jgi:hypothetical protein
MQPQVVGLHHTMDNSNNINSTLWMNTGIPSRTLTIRITHISITIIITPIINIINTTQTTTTKHPAHTVI